MKTRWIVWWKFSAEFCRQQMVKNPERGSPNIVKRGTVFLAHDKDDAKRQWKRVAPPHRLFIRAGKDWSAPLTPQIREELRRAKEMFKTVVVDEKRRIKK